MFFLCLLDMPSQCSAFADVDNGEIVYNPPGCAGELDCVATFQCDVGYEVTSIMREIVNTTRRTCQGTESEKNWSGGGLICELGMFIVILYCYNSVVLF